KRTCWKRVILSVGHHCYVFSFIHKLGDPLVRKSTAIRLRLGHRWCGRNVYDSSSYSSPILVISIPDHLVYNQHFDCGLPSCMDQWMPLELADLAGNRSGEVGSFGIVIGGLLYPLAF